MRRKVFFVVAVVAMAFCYLTGNRGESASAPGARIELRILYAGHPGSDREKDFVGFLEKHFTKVGKADLDKFEEKDAEGFDVVILDYSGLTIKGNAIMMPRVQFGGQYSRPTMTTSAAGALVCDHLNLKTGYL